MARIELTQARVRYFILGAFITGLMILMFSTESVRTPTLETIKAPFGGGVEQAPQPPTVAPPHNDAPPPTVPGQISDHKAGKEILPAPVSTDVDATEFMPLSEAEQYCAFRRFTPFPVRDRKRKVYDCIIVNTELEWLDIRLGQMASHVDYFVILEAELTFTDKKKPLYVLENMPRFEKYKHKIIRHTLNIDGVQFRSTWEREAFSRNAMVNQVLPFLQGEQKPDVDDVIIIADVDEIPRPDTITTLRNCEIPDALTLRSRMYYYSFQWLNRINGEWPHPQAMLWKGEDTREADKLRNSFNSIPALYNAAWHCSYCLGSLKDMVSKVTSFSHTEFNKPEFRDPAKILNRVRTGMDFFDREDSHFDRYEDNTDVPEFLLQNKDKYAYVLDRDPPDGNFPDAKELIPDFAA